MNYNDRSHNVSFNSEPSNHEHLELHVLLLKESNLVPQRLGVRDVETDVREGSLADLAHMIGRRLLLAFQQAITAVQTSHRIKVVQPQIHTCCTDPMQTNSISPMRCEAIRRVSSD